MKLRFILNFTGTRPVILCICQSVTDREVEAAIQDGARSLADVSRACGAGTDCGCCRSTIEQRLDRACSGSCADCPRREHELLPRQRADHRGAAGQPARPRAVRASADP